MSVELSVADVRQALLRSAPSDVIGSGEAATLLLGRLFHEVFADLVSADLNVEVERLADSAGDLDRAATDAEPQFVEHGFPALDHER